MLSHETVCLVFSLHMQSVCFIGFCLGNPRRSPITISLKGTDHSKESLVCWTFELDHARVRSRDSRALCLVVNRRSTLTGDNVLFSKLEVRLLLLPEEVDIKVLHHGYEVLGDVLQGLGFLFQRGCEA